MVEFIQKSGIPVAMVGLLQAMPGTQLFRRLRKEGRILDAGQGDNTDDRLNFLPAMDATQLVEGYHSVLKRIYTCEASYERVKLYLSRTHPKQAEGNHTAQRTGQKWLTKANARAFVTSIVRQGVLGKQRWSYWKFLMSVATLHRHCVGTAMTLAVMGYHFQVMTSRLSESVGAATLVEQLEGAIASTATRAGV